VLVKRAFAHRSLYLAGGLAIVAIAASCSKGVATPATIIEDTSIGYATVTSEAPSTLAPLPTAPLVAPTDAKACPATDGSAPQKRKFTAEPPLCIDVKKSYQATMETSEGTMVFDLLASRSPRTVNSFVFLARQKYFDGLTFHRVVKDFVLQGGDPLGTGSGGPGYSFADELPKANEYKVGSLAMANSGPNTNGSQFFVISGPNGVTLPPNYAYFGQLVVGKGEDVIKKVDALSPEQDGPPTKPVTIVKVTITEEAAK
jgi:cyclophilin family peptidyl-prolyl cis-trans isomerase